MPRVHLRIQITVPTVNTSVQINLRRVNLGVYNVQITLPLCLVYCTNRTFRCLNYLPDCCGWRSVGCCRGPAPCCVYITLLRCLDYLAQVSRLPCLGVQISLSSCLDYLAYVSRLPSRQLWLAQCRLLYPSNSVLCLDYLCLGVQITLPRCLDYLLDCCGWRNAGCCNRPAPCCGSSGCQR